MPHVGIDLAFCRSEDDGFGTRPAGEAHDDSVGKVGTDGVGSEGDKKGTLPRLNSYWLNYRERRRESGIKTTEVT